MIDVNMMTSIPLTDNLAALNQELSEKTPLEIMRYALTTHEQIAISFSGAEDVVLIDMALQLRKAVRIFCLDTGRLHAETYAFIDKVRTHYGVPIEICFPDAEAVRRLTTEKGLFSFYTEDHGECCGIRKTAPLRQQLATVDAWITGQRKDQSPTRTSLPVVENDTLFAVQGKTLTKYNPLAYWSSADVWSYIRMMEVPYNPLHEQGFVSIGCQPCTKAILPNQHEREGRWWWEDATKKECGLHAGNLK